MAAANAPGNRLRLTPSSSPIISRSVRSPVRCRIPPESRLRLQRVVGTTCRSPAGFDVVDSSFAYVAGAAVVVVHVHGQDPVQRFFRARPSAVPTYPTLTSQISSASIAATPKANDSRNRVALSLRDSPHSPADWSDSPGSKTWTSRERIKAATCLSLSRDGKFLAVGETGYAPRVLIYTLHDASPDMPLVSISEHAFGVNAVAWSADSRYLASLGTANDGFLFVWKIDARTGAAKLFQQNRCTSHIKELIWIGNSLITLGVRHVKIWKIEDAPAVSPTKQRFINESTPSTPTAQKPLPGRNVLLGDLLESTFNCAAVDGTRLMICTELGDVCILDEDDKQPRLIKVMKLDFQCTTLSIRNNIAYVGGKEGQLARLDCNAVFEKRAESVLTCIQTSSGLVASGFFEGNLVSIDTRRCVKIRNVDQLESQQAETDACVAVAGHEEPIAGVHALSKPNAFGAAFLTWSSAGHVTLWDINGQVKSVFDLLPQAVDFDDKSELSNRLTCVRAPGDGKLLAFADRQGILKVIDTGTKECLLDTKAHASHCVCISVFDESPCFIMASCGRDRTVQLFHRALNGIIEHFQTLEFSAKVVQVLVPSNNKVITCSLDRTLQIYTLLIREGEPDKIAAVCDRTVSLKASPSSMSMSSDDRSIFAALHDRTVYRFDLLTGREIYRFKCIDENGIEPVVLDSLITGQASPLDFDLILGSSNTDKSVRLYSANSGAFIDREWGHTEAISGVCLISDEDGTKRVVSAGSDGTIMIWTLDLGDAQSTREASPLKESAAGRQTLRKVISKAELAEFQRPPGSCGRRSPSRSVPRRSSRLNLKGNSAHARTPSGTVRLSPGACAIFEGIPTQPSLTNPEPPDSPPCAAKADALLQVAFPPIETAALKSHADSSHRPSGPLNLATEQACRNLRAYRKKLTSAEPVTADALTELDHELRLTAAALGDRAIRSKAMNETILSGLLDQYSERLVTLLDEKLRLGNPRYGQEDESSGAVSQRSSSDGLTAASP